MKGIGARPVDLCAAEQMIHGQKERSVIGAWTRAHAPYTEPERHDGSIGQHHLMALHLLDCVHAPRLQVSSELDHSGHSLRATRT
jgi:hypothetical protein